MEQQRNKFVAVVTSQRFWVGIIMAVAALLGVQWTADQSGELAASFVAVAVAIIGATQIVGYSLRKP